MEEAQGALKGLLGSLATSKSAKGRAETKVSAWEAKLASLREEGADVDRIRWGEANLRKAKVKVAEPEEAIEGFARAVRRSERELAAVVARVKEGEVEKVVEVDVEPEEAMVKDEEEAKVVVATPAGVGGVSQWLREMVGSRAAGAVQDLRWDPAVLAGPNPPNPDTPLLVAPESPVWTLRFLLVHVHHRLLGAGRWVWVDEGGGGVHLDRPLPLGVQNGWWGWQRELPGLGKRWGEVGPPPEKGVKMFELAQTNIFSPERKKGGGRPLAIRRQLLAGAGLGGG